MSKRCKLQSEYFNEYGNYKGHKGIYSNHYVHWLEDKILNLTNSTAKDCKMCRVLITKTK